MANLLRKTKDELVKLGKKLGIDTEGTKAELADRIQKAAPAKSAGLWLDGDKASKDALVTESKNARLKAAREKATREGKPLPAAKGFKVGDRH